MCDDCVCCCSHCTNNKFKQWPPMEPHRWPCLFNFCHHCVFMAAAQPAMQLFQSAANCSFPLLFLQSAFLLTTWPTNRLQIERKPAASYAPASALPSPARRIQKPETSLPLSLAQHCSPVQPGQPTCNLRQRRRHCSMSMAQPVSASFVVREGGSRPFVAALPFYVLRFTFFTRPCTAPGAGLRSCAQFFLCFVV